MAVQNVASEASLGKAQSPGAHLARWLAIAAIAVVAALAVVVGIFVTHWPFTEQGVKQALEHQSESRVEIAHFRQTYFPHPGCVSEGVTFLRDGANEPPLISARRIIIRGSYFGLLAHHISQITVDGFHLNVLPTGKGSPVPTTSEDAQSSTSDLKIDRITANGAVVEFPPTPTRDTPLFFTIHTLLLDHVSKNQPLSFHATLDSPEPPGEIRADGHFGPWQSGHGEKTALSGEFTFAHADLSAFHGIAGILNGDGKFQGELDHIKVEGITSVPDFQVTDAGHPMHLKTEFQALVNGLNGDVELKPVQAQFAKTAIVGVGEIEGRPDQKGKIVEVKLSSERSRVQDLLRMFTPQDPPAMVGPIVFRAGVVIPPERTPFLKKLRLDGDFGISGAQYTNRETQKNVDIASAKARGEAEKIEDDQDKDKKDGSDKTDQDLEHVVSNVKGHVVLRDGVAKFTNLSFDVPGATALVSGTYNLLNQKVDLSGVVHIDAKLSKATTGAKSFLLKIVQPFAKPKNDQGSIVALKITGTYRHPSFSVTPTAHK